MVSHFVEPESEELSPQLFPRTRFSQMFDNIDYIDCMLMSRCGQTTSVEIGKMPRERHSELEKCLFCREIVSIRESIA